MHCAILSSLYVRANGEIPCYDDAGAQIMLTSVSADRVFNADTELNNHAFSHIRSSLLAERMPWENTCKRCSMMRVDEPLKDFLGQRLIATLQVEPTLACGLLCPACTRTEDLKTRRKPHRLSPEDFAALLRGLRRDGYSVGIIEYCGNGEPMNNPLLAEFVKVGRRFFPNTRQRLITNGNFTYDGKLDSVHIDEFIISCDGAKQSSYEQYRVNGNINKVFDFMKSIPDEIAGYHQKKIWKYILFDFNDTDEEILLAQELKDQFGVHEIMFVRTHSARRSTRFDNGEALPTNSKNVLFDQTQMRYRNQRKLQATQQLLPRELKLNRGHINVESLSVIDNKKCVIRGWAVCTTGFELQFVCNNRQAFGTLSSEIYRPDVANVYPAYEDSSSGFEFCFERDFTFEAQIEITLKSDVGADSFVFPFADAGVE